MTGSTISHYKILEKLGEGGMGVVYKAEDTRLHRTVALKFLRAESVEDEELTMRFRHEAEAAASLDHSNICTIHEIDEADGQVFLAMAFVDGPSLKEAIAERPLKLDVALDLAIQIADGLAAAHEAGIVHRDIKPGNILMNRRRQVKILDFGLAHLGAATQITKTGTVIGTPAYMSPEQVRGEKADRRTDIWSLGVVLYEMLTGRVPFRGESGQAVALSIQNETPEPPTALRSGLPKELDRIVEKALAKEPINRYQHIEDLLVDVRRLKSQADSTSGGGEARPSRPNRIGWYIATAAVAGAAIAGVVIWSLIEGKAPSVEPRVVALTSYAGQEQYPSFSPEGREIAFSWNGKDQSNHDIYRKLIGPGELIQLTDDPADDYGPAWSPDGTQIALKRSLDTRTAGVYVIPATGGRERRIAEAADEFRHWGGAPMNPALCWTPDNEWLIFSDRSSDSRTLYLKMVSLSSGETHQLTSPPSGRGDEGPSLSPDGRRLAFVRIVDYGGGDVYVVELSDTWTPVGEPIRVTDTASLTGSPSWTPDGREILFSDGSWWGTRSLWRVPATGSGKPQRVPAGGDADLFTLSPDGSRLAYTKRNWDTDIWRVAVTDRGVADGRPERFVHTTRTEFFADMDPDGRVVYQSNQSGVQEIWLRDSDGANPLQVTHFGRGFAGSPDWSPDGRLIAFDYGFAGQYDIHVVDPEGGSPRQLTTSPSGDNSPSWSSDGRWIYFNANRTGQREIWKVRSTGGNPVQVTRKGGSYAMESPDGQYLYFGKRATEDYRSASLWRMPIEGGSETELLSGIQVADWAVTRQGVYYRPPAAPDGTHTFWFLDLATGRKHSVIDSLRYPFASMTVSPDGHWLVFNQTERVDDDLMLVENFR